MLSKNCVKSTKHTLHAKTCTNCGTSYTVSVCDKRVESRAVKQWEPIILRTDTPVHDTTSSDEKQQDTWKQIINHISALSCPAELDQLKPQPADGKQCEFLKQNAVNFILSVHQATSNQLKNGSTTTNYSNNTVISYTHTHTTKNLTC